ncbi:MAG: hypothetical protein QM811_22395 [Pirellulales bacterium]
MRSICLHLRSFRRHVVDPFILENPPLFLYINGIVFAAGPVRGVLLGAGRSLWSRLVATTETENPARRAFPRRLPAFSGRTRSPPGRFVPQ